MSEELKKTDHITQESILRSRLEKGERGIPKIPDSPDTRHAQAQPPRHELSFRYEERWSHIGAKQSRNILESYPCLPDCKLPEHTVPSFGYKPHHGMTKAIYAECSCGWSLFVGDYIHEYEVKTEGKYQHLQHQIDAAARPENGHAQAQPPRPDSDEVKGERKRIVELCKHFLDDCPTTDASDEALMLQLAHAIEGKTAPTEEEVNAFIESKVAAALPAEQPAFRDFGPMSCCICGDPTITRKFLPSEEMIALHVCKTEQPAPPPETVDAFLQRMGKELARRTNLIDFSLDRLREIAEGELRANTRSIDSLDTDETRHQQQRTREGTDRPDAPLDSEQPTVAAQPSAPPQPAEFKQPWCCETYKPNSFLCCTRGTQGCSRKHEPDLTPFTPSRARAAEPSVEARQPEEDWQEAAASEVVRWFYADYISDLKAFHSRKQIAAIIWRHAPKRLSKEQQNG